MKKNILCILANNPVMARDITLAFPKDPIENLSIVIGVDTRKFDVTSVARAFLFSDNVNFKRIEAIHTYSELAFWYSERVPITESGSEMLEKYALSMKILLPWYLLTHYPESKLLMSEDDCLIFQDPTELMDSNTFAARRLGFNQFTDTLHSTMLNGLNEYFGTPHLTNEIVNKYLLMAAPMVMSHKRDFIDLLSSFFSLPCLKKTFELPTKKTSRVTQFFLSEQKALEWYFAKNNLSVKLQGVRYGDHQVFKPEWATRTLRVMPTIIHYGVGKAKSKWVENYTRATIKNANFLSRYGLPELWTNRSNGNPYISQ